MLCLGSTAAQMSLTYFGKVIEIMNCSCELRRSFNGIAKQFAWTGSGVLLGGILSGPFGAMIGAFIGAMLGYRYSNGYDAFITSIQNITPEEKLQMQHKIQQLVGSTVIEDFITFIQSEQMNHYFHSRMSYADVFRVLRGLNKIFRCSLCSGHGKHHIPVMAQEVLCFLQPHSGQVIVDMTFGYGGHSREILGKASDVKLVCLDRDAVAVQAAQDLAKEYADPNQRNEIIALKGKFSDLPHLLKERNIQPGTVDGILLDAGCSSMQMEVGERGFSVHLDGPL
ncbi:unnamed protein product, partial [Soboliphyme baturini]|uniref:Methyltransferase-like protein 15 n=1 Tax=Soboliphyme baturini TaxID=241478 RepID=A0A183IT14_9BILA